MRYLGFVALAALAGCGGGGENETKAAAPDTLRAGQYEVTAESTQFRQADQGEAAFNMAVGDLVPLATIGTVMPSGIEISRSKKRGEWSNGMLCSPPELGLPGEEPDPVVPERHEVRHGGSDALVVPRLHPRKRRDARRP